MADLGVWDNPSAFIGIFLQFLIIYLKSTLDSPPKLITNRKGLPGNGIHIDASELDVSWSGEYFLEGLSIEFKLDRSSFSLSLRNAIQLTDINLIRIWIEALRITQQQRLIRSNRL